MEFAFKALGPQLGNQGSKALKGGRGDWARDGRGGEEGLEWGGEIWGRGIKVGRGIGAGRGQG